MKKGTRVRLNDQKVLFKPDGSTEWQLLNKPVKELGKMHRFLKWLRRGIKNFF